MKTQFPIFFLQNPFRKFSEEKTTKFLSNGKMSVKLEQ